MDSLKVVLDARVRELADRAADRQREVETLSANQRKMEGQISSIEDIIRLVARQNQGIKEMLAEERPAPPLLRPHCQLRQLEALGCHRSGSASGPASGSEVG